MDPILTKLKEGLGYSCILSVLAPTIVASILNHLWYVGSIIFMVAMYFFDTI
jgi:hypothetical protein